jgi:hypothetical protein
LKFVISATIGILAISMLGCRARPAPAAGFNEDPGRMSLQPKDAAFQRLYLDPNHKWGGYTQLYVAPVNMHYMMTQSFWEKASEANLSKEEVQKSADAIAQYTRQAFIKAAQTDPRKHFTVVDTPSAGANTLILETAIVQLVPSKAVLNALGFVSWIPTAVMMGGSAASGSEDQGKGLVAIEGRVRDGASGQVVGEFADRERPPSAIVDLKSLNWWAPAKKVIDNWAKQFVELSNSPSGKVKNSSTFELLVW